MIGWLRRVLLVALVTQALAACLPASMAREERRGTPTPMRATATADTVARSPIMVASPGTPVGSATATTIPHAGTPRPPLAASPRSTATPGTPQQSIGSSGVEPPPSPPPTPPTPTPIPGVSGAVPGTVHALPERDDRFGAIAFIDARRGWSAVGATILVTDDGGYSWTPQHEAAGRVTHLDALPSGQGWAATEAGLLMTHDGGATWRTLDTQDLAPVERVDFVDAEHGWIGVRGRPDLLRTSDGGKSWTPATSPCFQLGGGGPFSFIRPDTGWMHCSFGGAGGTSEKAVFKTEDGGHSWELLTQSTRQYQPPNGLPMMSGDSDLFFLNDTDGWLCSPVGLLATTDGGRSWRAVRAGAILWIGGEGPRNVWFVSGDQGYVVFAGSRTALLVTEDAGTTWTLRSPTILPPRYWFQPFDRNEGVAAGTLFDRGAILRTSDGGRNWRQVGSLGNVHVLALSFSDPQHGWAITSERTRALHRTTDGGATWTPLPSLPSDLSAGGVSLSFVDTRTGYVQFSRGQLFVTRDGGETFQPVSAERAGGDYGVQIKFVTSHTGWRTADLRLQATADGGNTWTPIPLDCWVKWFDLLPGGRGRVLTEDCGLGPNRHALLATSDGGATWTRYNLGSPRPFASAVVFADAAHGWAWREWGYLYRTEDGGRTWVQVQ